MSDLDSIAAHLQIFNIEAKFLDLPGLFAEDSHRQTVFAYPESAIVRTIVADFAGVTSLIAVPWNCLLDVTRLNQSAKTRLDIAESGEPVELPLGRFYKLPLVLDTHLAAQQVLHFPCASGAKLLELGLDALYTLQESYTVQDIATALEDVPLIVQDPNHRQLSRQLRETLLLDTRLPAMPEMGARILEVCASGNANATTLANVLEADPSLCAQIIHTAQSAFYAYRGKINSIRDAIARVLGFDTVANMALGIAIGKSFSIPFDGPLGLRQFWRQAIYSAALCERLASLMPRTLRPDAGDAYLAGLLQNIGYLLLGHLHDDRFRELNSVLRFNPGANIELLEQLVLGLSHCEIGATLLRHWQMPEEVVVACLHHHNPNYHGEHACYAHLVLLANYLLASTVTPSISFHAIPETSLQATGLDVAQLQPVLPPLIAACLELDTLSELTGD